MQEAFHACNELCWPLHVILRLRNSDLHAALAPYVTRRDLIVDGDATKYDMLRKIENISSIAINNPEHYHDTHNPKRNETYVATREDRTD